MGRFRIIQKYRVSLNAVEVHRVAQGKALLQRNPPPTLSIGFP